MPSACTKPDKKASPEVETPMKQCLNIVEKKVRNLEKRKGKLDGYREKAASGSELNDDQKKAVSQYDGVVRDLDMAREFLKQFTAVQGDVEKTSKKQLKRESHERQQAELRRIKDMLALQNLLDGLGAEDVRADFSSGAKGAIKLSEKELDSLDELYKLISPTREEETKFCDQLMSAAEHLANFLDAREKDVAGTTYKNLKTTVEKITECGYFDRKASEQPAEELPEAAAVVEEDVTNESEQEAASHVTAEAASTEATDYSLKQQQQLPTESPQQPAAAATAPVTPAATANLDFAGDAATAAMLGQSQQQQQTGIDEDTPAPAEDTFFSTQPFLEPRGFNEIVSSVQSNFTFLQDSELEAKNSKQQQQAMDPAVMAAAAAQMGGAAPAVNQQPPTADLSFLSDTTTAAAAQSQFQAAQELSDGQSASGLQFSSSSELQQPSSAASSTQPPVSAFENDPSSMYSGSSAAAAQGLMAQGIQNGSQQYESSQGGAGFGADSAAADSGPPQPIPMPGQYEAAEQTSAAAAAAAQNANRQQFAMNPNADIFQSMYTGGDPQQQQQSAAAGYGSQQQSGAAAGAAGGVDGRQQQQTQQAWGSSSAADFQSQGYSGPYAGRRGNQQSGAAAASAPGGYRGNQQPRNSAGGPNNMNGGGYRGNSNPRSAPGNQRGGNPRGAGYNGAANRGPAGGSSGSGGGTYKGYPARNDYQPEGGYQGYNASSTGFMQPSQGGPRGGPRNSVPRNSRNNGNYGNRMQPQ